MVLVVFSVVYVNKQRARHVPCLNSPTILDNQWHGMNNINPTPSRLKIKRWWNSECLFLFSIRHFAQFISLVSFLFFLFSFNFIVFIFSWIDGKVLIRQEFVFFPDLNNFVSRHKKKSAFAIGVFSLRDVFADWNKSMKVSGIVFSVQDSLQMTETNMQRVEMSSKPIFLTYFKTNNTSKFRLRVNKNCQTTCTICHTCSNSLFLIIRL